jgi:hypothetical protein
MFVKQLIHLTHTPNEANYQRRCCAVTLRRAKKINKQTLVVYLYSKLEEAKVMRSFMRKVIVSVIAVLAGFAGVAQALNVDQSSGAVYVKNEYVPDRVIEMPYAVASDAKCGQWWQLMADLGWSDADIAKGDGIIFRESRCNADSVNAKDPTTIGKFKGSFGLYQINLYWIKKTAWYPKGFLQTKLERNLVPTDLLLPEINIAAAGEIIKQNRADGGCGWSAWRSCK